MVISKECFKPTPANSLPRRTPNPAVPAPVLGPTEVKATAGRTRQEFACAPHFLLGEAEIGVRAEGCARVVESLRERPLDTWNARRWVIGKPRIERWRLPSLFPSSKSGLLSAIDHCCSANGGASGGRWPTLLGCGPYAFVLLGVRNSRSSSRRVRRRERRPAARAGGAVSGSHSRPRSSSFQRNRTGYHKVSLSLPFQLPPNAASVSLRWLFNKVRLSWDRQTS